MPARRNGIPDFFDVNDSASKVLCTICNRFSKVSPGWISCKSYKKHVDTYGHITAVKESEQISKVLPAGSPCLESTGDVAQFIANTNSLYMFNTQTMTTASVSTHSQDHSKSTGCFDYDAVFEDLCHPAANFLQDVAPRQVNLSEHLDSQWAILAAEDTVISSVSELNQNGDEYAEILMNGDMDTFDLTMGNHNPMLDAFVTSHVPNTMYYPYPNITMFWLDYIDNLPRLRISDSLMKIFLMCLQECGAANVPSFAALRKFQDSLRTAKSGTGIQARRFESVLGNVFYMNDIGAIVAQSLANERTCSYLQFYPVEVPLGSSVSEIWHGDKWNKCIPLDSLTPMYVAPTGAHFYVNEFCQDRDTNLFIPVRWVVRGQELCADAYPVNLDSLMRYNVDDSMLISIKAINLVHNYFDLLKCNHPVTNQVSHRRHDFLHQMPNRLRELAEGDPLYSIFIDKWNDDVSGNVSKSYNKHFNTAFTIRNLPRSLLQQEFNIHFVGTSICASPAEQTAAVNEMILETHIAPVKTYNASLRIPCRCRIFLNAETSDNPMQSEECSHIGPGGNHLCRKCNVGGTHQEKENGITYTSLFLSGKSRTKEETRAEIEAQVRMAATGVTTHVKAMQSASGIKDRFTQVIIDQLLERHKKAKVQHSSWSKEAIGLKLNRWIDKHMSSIISPAMSLTGYDPHFDTPIELLHTILLGVVKYVWHGSHTLWNSAQKAQYTARLQASNITGTASASVQAEYIVQYANSLIGRQFKAILQFSTFHIHDLVSSMRFQLWKAIGEMSALLWYPAIANKTQYLEDLNIAIANVLDLFAELDPSIITSKIKLHLLCHAPEDIVRFGPLIGMATETMESFNAVFRRCSILSNHQSPSRDIALQMGQLEAAKHRFTGGYWQTPAGEWVRLSAALQQKLERNPRLLSLMGWTEEKVLKPGSVVLAPVSKRVAVPWKSTAGPKLLYVPQASFTEARWLPCTHIYTQSTDKCSIGAWVCAQASDASMGACFLGRIIEIWKEDTRDSKSESLVFIQRYFLATERHPTFDMPVLVKQLGVQGTVGIGVGNTDAYCCDRDGITTKSGEIVEMVKAEHIMFDFNCQHDCLTGQCSETGNKKKKQEREGTSTTVRYIEHQDDSHFIVNLHSLHNPHLIRDVLPRNLTAPRPLPGDRKARHYELAARLHTTQEGKRMKAHERRAALRAEKQDLGSKNEQPEKDIREAIGGDKAAEQDIEQVRDGKNKPMDVQRRGRGRGRGQGRGRAGS